MFSQSKTKTINKERNIDFDRRIMLFDLALGGHHGNYIKYLIDYWCQYDLPGFLDIVVAPEFSQVHTDVVESIAGYQHPKIELIEIKDSERATANFKKSAISRAIRNLQEWELYCYYAKSRQTTSALLMYLDTSEIPLVIGRKSPCPFSGIYFRPSFHYSKFSNYQPSWKDRLQQIREKLALRRILSHPQLQNIFCLDPFAVESLRHNSDRTQVSYLADPVEIEQFTPKDAQLSQLNLKIESGRTVFLMLGALDERKGVYRLLDALNDMSTNICRQICLLFIGGTNLTEQAKIKQRLQEIVRNKPLQVIEEYKFIPDWQVRSYFQLADVVLAPYQKHVGMSGILIRAAAAGKPVLSSNYGLMGEMVRQYDLGMTIDSSLPKEIERGIRQYLTTNPKQFGDRSKMLEFARQNSVENYVNTIFNNI